MKNIFLTGEVGIGKSTILAKIIDKLEKTIGGYKTFPVHNEGKIIDYDLVSLYDGSYGNFIGTIFKMKKDYKKASYVFDNVGVDILDKSFKYRDIIVLDEIGIIESRAFKFQNKINTILDSPKLTLGILKKVDSLFLDSIRGRDDVTIFDVNLENRDYLEEEILKLLIEWDVALKIKHSLRWNENSINWYQQTLSHPDNEYPSKIIKEIEKKRELVGEEILDVGSGIGVFTFPLAEKNNLTAVDSSFLACEYIGGKTREKSIKNIKFITGYWQDIYYEDKKDIAICAYCPDAVIEDNNLEKLYNLVLKRIYIIAFEGEVHRNFKVGELCRRLNRPERRFKCTDNDIEEELIKLNYEYEKKKIDYEFSQYFSKYEDALLFFYHHFSIKNNREKEVLDEFLKENLEEKDNQIKFKNIRSSIMFTVNKELSGEMNGEI